MSRMVIGRKGCILGMKNDIGFCIPIDGFFFAYMCIYVIPINKNISFVYFKLEKM